MGKNLIPAQAAQISNPVVKTRRLITINLKTPFRILENDSTGSIVINAKKYYTKLVQTSAVKGSVDGNSESVDVVLSDISQDFALLIANDGDVLTNTKCKIEQVIFNGDTNDIVGVPIPLFDGLINKVQLSQTYCAFSVERQLYSYSTVSPNMTYDVNCQFQFGVKDSRCGYSGTETKCDKTLARCQVLGKVLNFGGYPSVIIPMSAS